MLVDVVVVVVVNRTSLRPIISFPTEHLNQSDEEQKKTIERVYKYQEDKA